MGFLRIYLALCVVASHSDAVLPWQMHSGRQAVQLFFLISGFYIELILSGKYHDIRSFYKGRALRIFMPLGIITAGICLLSLATHLIFDDWLSLSAFFNDPLSRNGLAGIVFATLSNITVFGQDWVMLLKHDAGQSLSLVRTFGDSASPLYQYLIIPPAWSIAIELSFYLLAPFLHRLRTSHLILVAATSLALRFAGAHLLGLSQQPWNYRFFPFEVAHFVYGMLAFRFYRHYRDILPAKLRLRGRASYVLFVASALAFLWAQRKLSNALGALFGSEYSAVAIMIAWIPLIAILFALLEKHAFDRLIGELSYPIYLIHIAIIALIGLFSREMMLPPIPLGAVAALASVIAAFALHQLCLRRLEEWRQRRLAAMPAVAANPA
ncbi:MAG TPA: acyltransferase [Prosthecobacter sp.]|nr:acyltransferase [Prosthecobacter sp.]